MGFIKFCYKTFKGLTLLGVFTAGVGTVVGHYCGYDVASVYAKVVEKLSPNTSLLEQTQQALDAGYAELNERQKKVESIQADEERTEQHLKTLNEELERQERILVQAGRSLNANRSTVIAADEPSVTIGDQKFTFNQLNEDLVWGVGRCERLRESIAAIEASLGAIRHEKSRLLTFLEERTTRLKEVERTLQVKKAEVAALSAHRTADAQTQEPERAFSRVAATNNAIDQRLEEIRRTLELNKAAQPAPNTHRPLVDKPSGRVADAILEYLNQHGLENNDDKIVARAKAF